VKLLALDTATDACSVALLIDDQVRQDFRIAPREHARLLLPMIETLLAEAGLAPVQLDAVAFGRGPGSFTGLRIAAGVTQGIALGADLPVAPVSTLAALAQGALREDNAERVLAALDARMNEVYWGAFGHGADNRMQALGGECVCAPGDAPVPGEGQWQGVGSGWAAYADALSQRCGSQVAHRDPDRRPQARDIALLAAPLVERGEALAPELALPVYLRDRVAAKPAQHGGR
jgi:tRNA threonylcarbamoyladenosine biosynthesis protein TsaB